MARIVVVTPRAGPGSRRRLVAGSGRRRGRRGRAPPGIGGERGCPPGPRGRRRGSRAADPGPGRRPAAGQPGPRLGGRRGDRGVRRRDPGPGPGRDSQTGRRRPGRRDPRRSGARHRPNAQGIQRGLLEQAYAAFPPPAPPTFTDEAALLEACRIPVHAVPGDPMNLKVTLPGDVDRAEAALLGRARRWPAGCGSGSGRMAIRSDRANRSPWAGSRSTALRDSTATPTATLPSTPSPMRCSGASGLGDLGRIFPAGPTTPAGSPAQSSSRRSWPGCGRGTGPPRST